MLVHKTHLMKCTHHLKVHVQRIDSANINQVAKKHGVRVC